MKIALAQTHFDEGVGVFDEGCVLRNTEGREVKIVKFSGFSEIDETDGTEHEVIKVHFDDDSVIEFEDLDRAVFRDRSYEPVSPDWFVEEVKDHRGESDEDKESEAERKQKAQAAAGTKRIHAEVKAQVAARPVENLTDPELFAKVSGAPVSIAEEMVIAYEGNLGTHGRIDSKADAEGVGYRQSEV